MIRLSPTRVTGTPNSAVKNPMRHGYVSYRSGAQKTNWLSRLSFLYLVGLGGLFYLTRLLNHF